MIEDGVQRGKWKNERIDFKYGAGERIVSSVIYLSRYIHTWYRRDISFRIGIHFRWHSNICANIYIYIYTRLITRYFDLLVDPCRRITLSGNNRIIFKKGSGYARHVRTTRYGTTVRSFNVAPRPLSEQLISMDHHDWRRKLIHNASIRRGGIIIKFYLSLDRIFDDENSIDRRSCDVSGTEFSEFPSRTC